MRAILHRTGPHLAAAAALLVAAGPASAQERPQSPAMTCTQATALVRARGAVVLGTGTYTYDRYVSDQSGCQINEVAEADAVPTRDDPRCFAGYRCRGRRSSGGGN